MSRPLPLSLLLAGLILAGCDRPEALDAPPSDAARSADRQVLAPIADLLAEPAREGPDADRPETLSPTESLAETQDAAAALRSRGAALADRPGADAETRAEIAARRARLDAARADLEAAASE